MYNRAQVKQTAKEQMKNNYGIALGTSIVAALILGAVSFTVIGTLLLAGPITVGLSFVFIAIVRGSGVEFGDMFKGFNNFGNTFLCGLLTGVFTFLWSLLFIIPGIVKAFAYSMAPYILADNPEMGGLEAITASKEMMNGHKGELFVLYLSFIGWFLLSCLTFGLLQLFYVGPYMEAAKAAFYEAIKNQNAPEPAPAPTTEEA